MNQDEYNALSVEDACEYMAAKAAEAVEAGTYTQICMGGEPVFYVAHDHGIMPGHIYSELGMKEFQISRSCEYHFDEWTKEPEEEYEDA